MLKNKISNAYNVIAPLWPLKSFIARNPLEGFTSLPFEEALKKGNTTFTNGPFPEPLKAVNRLTIKWCQAFFDKGNAAINMPHRHRGLFYAFKMLAPFDSELNHQFIKNLSENPEETIDKALEILLIAESDQEQFLTHLLTTLPGWSGYIKYLAEWDKFQLNESLFTEYLAMRCALVVTLYPDAQQFLKWAKKEALAKESLPTGIGLIRLSEAAYIEPFTKALEQQNKATPKNPDVQFLFCIDPRSEIIRRAIETMGNYETFGIAGFFGLPVFIANTATNKTTSSCPVIVDPLEQVMLDTNAQGMKNKTLVKNIKRSFNSVKYNYTTPFALAEAAGLVSAALLIARTFFPQTAARLANLLIKKTNKNHKTNFSLNSIDLADRVTYVKNALCSIGLTKNFAPFVIICGHGAKVTNNPYKSSLQCGACGGNSGYDNARIFVELANDPAVRDGLQKNGIIIPKNTLFIAGAHDTVTDGITLSNKVPQTIIENLKAAQKTSCKERMKLLGDTTNNPVESAQERSTNWAQVQPEWGLANNASFIIGPRSITKGVNLEGRTFLHSYEWETDTDGAILASILNGPVTVAQWINHQYLFSRLSLTHYGSGDKVTHNVTSKIGVMQGNASDLLTGLPLQSIYKKWNVPFHEPIRLIVVIYAPQNKVDQALATTPHIKKLIDNNWLTLHIPEPKNLS